MKSQIRIAVLALLGALCLSLCSCQALEDMKATHATMDDRGHIHWNGHTYVALSGTDEELNLNYDTDADVYVTTADVPVLLSQIEGEAYSVHADGNLLSSSGYDPLTDSYKEVVYCRSDLAKWANDALRTGATYTTYFLSYWDDYAWESKEYTLTAQQKEAVETVLTTVTPFAIYGGYDQAKTAAQLWARSEYDLFRSRHGYLDKSYGRYYIIMENYNESAGWGTDCYDVPDALTSIFDEIYKVKEEATDPNRENADDTDYDYDYDHDW